MTLAYAAKLGLTIQNTSVKAQKIDGSTLETYSIVLAGFSLQDNLKKVWFFKGNFLLADTSLKMVLEMSVLFLNKIEVEFAELRKLT